MKLYSGPLSLFTAKVRIALAEKGLAYEKISVRWTLTDRYLPHHPEVARINPKGEVPCLVDGDLELYDSTQILEYLEGRQPTPPLYPEETGERARCRRLEAYADEILFAPLWDLIEERFYPAPPGGRDEARIAAAEAAIAEHQRRLDAELGERDHFCGPFTVADIGLFVMSNALATLGTPVPASLPSLAAWFARVGERPAVKQEVEEMGAFAARTIQEALAGSSGPA